MLAELEAENGDCDSALVQIEQGLALADEAEERFTDPYLHQLRGEYLLKGPGVARPAAPTMRCGPTCTLYSPIKGQAAICDWFRANHDWTGNLPCSLGSIFVYFSCWTWGLLRDQKSSKAARRTPGSALRKEYLTAVGATTAAARPTRRVSFVLFRRPLSSLNTSERSLTDPFGAVAGLRLRRGQGSTGVPLSRPKGRLAVARAPSRSRFSAR
jgi:hypothetical protein